jgi:hypothetical protein
MAIQFRRDARANWNSVNPTLLSGEPAYETNTQLLKIGDGSTPYNSLPYFGIVDQAAAGGRLSVVQNVSLPPGDSAGGAYDAATILYYVPHVSDKIGLWSGTGWRLYTFDNNTAFPLSGLIANKLYDIFAYQSNGTVTFAAAQWQNNYTRNTADRLVSLNGVLVRTGAANQRYIGTIRTTATGTTADNLTRRFVYNYCNQALRTLRLTDGTIHTYAAPYARPWNNSTLYWAGFVTGRIQPVHVEMQAMVRWGYFTPVFMRGSPVTLNVTANAALGATKLFLSALPEEVYVSGSVNFLGAVAGDTQISAVNTAESSITLNKPLIAAISAGTAVTISGWYNSISWGYNGISPSQLANAAFIFGHVSGNVPAIPAGFNSIIPYEFGTDANTSFNSFVLHASLMM